MKYGFKFIVLLSTLLTLGFSVAATAGGNCGNVDFTGQFRAIANRGDRYIFVQKGCDVSMYDVNENGHWHFDLSGKTGVPDSDAMIKNNSISDASLKAAESTRIWTTLVGEGPDYNCLNVRATLNVPKSMDNPFDVNVEIDGQLYLATTTVNGKPLVDHIYMNSTRVRLTGINDSYFQGALGNAFLSGANYILDRTDLGSFLRPTVEIERVSP